MRAAVALVAVIFASGCEPTPGSPCSTTDTHCSGWQLLQCIAGQWKLVACRGPGACVQSAGGAACDTSVGIAGDACPPDLEGKPVCSTDRTTELRCLDGLLNVEAACPACAGPPGSVTCATGGGGGAGGGGTGGSGGGAAGGGSADPCLGVPATGRCLNAQNIEYCSTPTGSGSPTVQLYPCVPGTACSQVGAGPAQCVATGLCVPGSAQCLGANQLQTCTAGGTWSTTTCPAGCASSVGGATCRLASSGTRSGSLLYQVRGRNATYPTDWSATLSSVVAPGFLAVSFTQCGTGCKLVDSTVTNAQGGYTLSVPANPDAGDVLAFAALALTPDGGVAYLVADPQIDGGVQDIYAPKASPRAWVWTIPTGSVTPGGTITIQEAGGSGAARVFDYLRYAYARSANVYAGARGLSLIAWVGFRTSWSCGSCFSTAPTTAFGMQFGSQLWFNGSTSDQEYWSDAVTAHELGHWVMASYGLPPGEAGRHCVASPDPPGMAWSEGWATWHSSDVRGDPVYYDKQGGSMFYLDLSARTYSPGHGWVWARPTPALGLLQDLDENELSAMLWSISSAAAGADARLFAALASPRMTTRISAARTGAQSNLRGYTRHRWTSACPISGRQDTGYPTPALPDFLDALVCGGLSAAAVDAATNPTTAYPYPSASPLCQ